MCLNIQNNNYKLWNASVMIHEFMIFRGAFLIVNNLRGDRIGFLLISLAYQNSIPGCYYVLTGWFNLQSSRP